jgi:hypothetical protein
MVTTSFLGTLETRGQDTVTTWVGGTAPWEYITLHIGVMMTLKFFLPLLVPRTPAGWLPGYSYMVSYVPWDIRNMASPITGAARGFAVRPP